MPRTFRFRPPEPRPGSLTRPRLLRALAGRWDHRVTVLVGGAGLGKTTLLAQMMAENRLAPRGEDVWIGLAPGDADGDVLARDVVRALGGSPAPALPPPTTAETADTMWARAPTAICLVIDDAHLLASGSPGAAWLADVVAALPANGHMLLASRSTPAVPLARLATQGEVVRLDEEDLRFTDDEVAGFAARRGIVPDRLVETGGWPAMAELAASVEGDRGRARDRDYLWEEVLGPLGPERREVLAVVSDIGGADDALASAVLGAPVDVGRALDGVPLVATGVDGWRVPHPLWRGVAGLALAENQRVCVRRRAIEHLTAIGRYDEAVQLATEAGSELLDVLPYILRAVCVDPARPPAGRLESWLARCPADVLETPAGRLATGLHRALTAPDQAAGPLSDAVAALRGEGDDDAEIAGLVLLGRVAWWRSDVGLLASIAPRVAELGATGHPLARALAALGRAVTADLTDDDATVLAELDTIPPGVLDAYWSTVAGWLRASVTLSSGDAPRALELTDAIPPAPDPAFALTVRGQRLGTLWALGRVDEALAGIEPLLEDTRASGLAQNLFITAALASTFAAYVGDTARARRFLADANDASAGTASTAGRLAVATAAVELAEGDETGAAATLGAALQAQGLDVRSRRVWRPALALSYVLLPETRSRWDDQQLRGHVARARELARTVVALRATRDGRQVADVLAGVTLPDPELVRTALPHRFVVELAVALSAGERAEGVELIDTLGPPGRAVVREIAASSTTHSRAARALLAAAPALPAAVTDVAVLGPLRLSRGGRPVSDPDLRRERVRALLAYLVTRRSTTRTAIIGSLWPDLDERAGANNLRVTLTHLLRLLEPWRAAGESPYLVRLDGQQVTLHVDEWLRLDVDAFDGHVGAATRAEADGAPSLALDHHRAAVALWRGELHAELPDAEWCALDREHYRTRFVAAAIRAGQLLVGRAESDEAEAMARAALAVDSWSEGAYGVLVGVALARGDRSAARRALDHCLAALDDLGVEPGDETRRLRRMVRAGSA
jgi:LuxR family transcriptional regulator, maltose regulon positive regulatory protein